MSEIKTYDGDKVDLVLFGTDGDVQNTAGKLVTVHPPGCVLMVPCSDEEATHYIDGNGVVLYVHPNANGQRLRAVRLTPTPDASEAAFQKFWGRQDGSKSGRSVGTAMVIVSREAFLAGYNAAKESKP